MIEKYSDEWFSKFSTKPITENNNLLNSEKKYCKFEEDKSLIDFSPDNLPLFYNMIMDDEYLTEESKNEFINEFWNKYIKTKKFRKSVIGKYLFWFNKIFIGVIDNICDVDDYGTRADSKYIIKISNQVEKNYKKHVLLDTYKNEIKINRKILLILISWKFEL